MMKEVILLLTVLVMFIVCFFVMGKIGYFINENYKAFIIEERENTQSCKIISLDKISDEELLRLVNDLYPIIEKEHLSMFEIDTIIMLNYFHELDLDYHVIE